MLFWFSSKTPEEPEISLGETVSPTDHIAVINLKIEKLKDGVILYLVPGIITLSFLTSFDAAINQIT